jgi:phosphoserine phosphatase
MVASYRLHASAPAGTDAVAALLGALGADGGRLTELRVDAAAGRTLVQATLRESPDRDPAEALRARGLRLDAAGPLEEDRESRAPGERIAHVLTVIAPEPPGEGLADLTELLRGAGLVTRSARTLRAADRTRGPVLELSVAGELADPDALRGALRERAEALGVDVALRPADVWRTRPRLAVFDMDSTLIATEVVDELADRAGSGAAVRAVTERAMRGELDFARSLTERVATLAGLPETVLEDVADTLPPSPGVERLMAVLRRLGVRTVIVSGGFTFFAERLCARFRMDEHHANRLEIEAGHLTGRVEGRIVDARGKAATLEALTRELGLPVAQTIAVGDGANDLPMLGKAGLGVAYRAKPVVRAQAQVALSRSGLDGLLYVLGLTEAEIEALAGPA